MVKPGYFFYHYSAVEFFSSISMRVGMILSTGRLTLNTNLGFDNEHDTE